MCIHSVMWDFDIVRYKIKGGVLKLGVVMILNISNMNKIISSNYRINVIWVVMGLFVYTLREKKGDLKKG